MTVPPSPTSLFRSPTPTYPSIPHDAALDRQRGGSFSVGGAGGADTASIRSRSPFIDKDSLRAASIYRGKSTPPVGQQSQTPPLRALDSYSVRNVASTLSLDGIDKTDDVWQAVCVRVLPLFNGEGLKGYVEDINDLVNIHVQRTLTRSTQPRRAVDTILVCGLLTSDLTDLISIGCLTLYAKLAPPPPAPPLSDDEFLSRLADMWTFFWSNVCPTLESVFVGLRCDPRLRSGSSNIGVAGAREREKDRDGRTDAGARTIDIRRLALITFRDRIILPEIDQILTLFSDLGSPHPHTEIPPSPSPPQDPLPTPSQPTPLLLAQRRQMVAILATCCTNDQRQAEVDALLSLLRSSNGAHPNSHPNGERSPTATATESGYATSRRTGPQFPPSMPPDLPRSTTQTSATTTLSVAESGFAAPPRASSPFQPSRPRANTLESVDETVSPVVEPSSLPVTVAQLSAQPLPTVVPPVTSKRRNFLPRIGRSKSGNPGDRVGEGAKVEGRTSGGSGNTTPGRREASD